MDESAALAKFGLMPDAAQCAEVRALLEAETANEREAQGRGDTELMRVCCVQLFNLGAVDDILRIWAAKSASMDANGAIDMQLLCGAGLERTKAHLRGREDAAARAALARICDVEDAGDFAEFTPALWSGVCCDYYETPHEVRRIMLAEKIHERTKLVGYWRESLEQDSPLPHPQTLRSPGWVAAAEKRSIVEYLRSGNQAACFAGYSFCRIEGGPDNEQMGCRELTDGEWIWPEGLAVYVDMFDVRLPEEFVATMRRHAYVVPQIDESRAERLGDVASPGFWVAWSRRLV